MEQNQIKRTAAVLVVLSCLLALSFALIGCGGNAKDKFVGNWELESMESAEMGTVDATGLKSFGLSVSLTLNADGSGNFNLFGESVDATWDLQGDNAINMTLSGAGSTVFTLENGLLVGDSNGTKMSFKKAAK